MTKSETNKIVDSLPELKTIKKGGKNIQLITELPDSVKSAIDNFKASDEAAKRQAEMATMAKRVVVEHASELQDRYGQDGQHSKSFRLEGNSAEVTFTRADKFSVSKETTYKDLEAAAGKKFAKDNFEVQRSLQVNPTVMKTPAKLKKLVAALQEALGDELGDYFVQDSSVVAKKGLDTSQFELSDEKRKALLGLVKQSTGGLRG
jgi:hypothetical protein